MEPFNITIAVCVACAFCYVVSSLLIYNALQKRNMPVSFLWLRAMAPVYAFRYKKITISETGKTGSLFYHWIISINLALAFAVAAVIIAL